MSISRIAGLFLAVAVSVSTRGSATAGWDEANAAYERGDYQTAFRESVPLAVAGDSSAQVNVGLMYYHGQGVPQNYTEALRWYRMAAAQGNASARFNLGAMYYHGQGVPQDYAEAARWCRMAAEQGHADAQTKLGAMYVLGQGVPQNYAEAVRWLRMAAEQGGANAQYYLGGMHASGQGVPQNDAEAVRWYQRAAEQGDAEAQASLGAAYTLGKGVPQNDTEAMRWYRRAADQGDVGAQLILGMSYALGKGVRQDYVQAYVWLDLAAARLPQGEDRSQTVESRDKVAALLSPAQRAQAQEMARNWQPESVPVPGVAAPPRALTDEEVLGKSAAVEDVQAQLAALGYDPGPADGVMGQRTRAAIRAFQADVGLPVDGQASDRLIAALSDAGAGAGSAPDLTAAADTGSERTGARPWERYAEQRRLEGTGTGFAVSEDGQIVTNHHVVADCAEVRVRPGGREALAGAVLAQDPGNDLALLRVPVHMAAAAIRDDGGIRAGDSVVAVGFPLPGLLASEASVTTGTVSALAGIGNDTRLFQVTVPVQPGNSGGPLLDLHGRVVGVVIGKLDAVQIASVTGDIPQNVNFAIKAGILRSFLDASGVAVAHRDLLADPAYAIPLSPAAVVADAKAFTGMVECWK
jgi:TPR repeat protein/S1-C subfamily serine protease